MVEYKTREENFQDSLKEMAVATDAELLDVIHDPRPYHSFFIEACKQVLTNRGIQS